MAEPAAQSAPRASPLRRFRVPIVIAVLLVLYALAGFFLAPWVLKRRVPGIARAEFSREAAVERLEVNPFALSLRLQGFRLKDKVGSLLAGLDELFVNFDAESLFRRAFTFSELRLGTPYLKIDLDLRYQLKDWHVVGSNKIVIDEIGLGEKVPNPEAIDLPLGLAVALLKDADGRIDIDMPVTGSLDDPEFGIGMVMWKAFVNRITKIVTSPFRLLGNLIGIESEDLGRIE